MVSVRICIFPFLDCSRHLICLFMYFSETNGEEKPSVAICDGSSKYIDWTTGPFPEKSDEKAPVNRA